MTAVPALTEPPEVSVQIVERVEDAEVCPWKGSTGRMCPTRIYVTYHARLGAPQWWVSTTLEGPTVRRDGRPGERIAHEAHYFDEDGDTLRFAPGWVREFVRINEPPAYMRGA